MNLHDLLRTFEVDPAVAELIQSIEHKTGKTVEFRIDKRATAPASVKVARNRMSFHLLTIDPACSSTASYLIANKCANILRIAGVHPEDRVVPATTDVQIQSARTDLERSGAHVRRVSSDVIAYWVGGVVNQLTNLPVQVRIERWIATNFPQLAAQQQQYLESEIAQTVAGASTDVQRAVPQLIFERSNAMTYAYVRAIGELLEKNHTQSYNRYPSIIRTGKELYAMIGDVDDESAITDVKLVDMWAAHLGLDTWFVWQDFESMPESYYNDLQS